MGNEPTRALGQSANDQKQHERISLHHDNRDPPCPLVRLAERVCDPEVDTKGHVESKNVHLELLREGLAPGIVAAQLAAIHWNHRVDTAHPKAHNQSPDPEHVNGILGPPAQPCEEHDKVT